MAPETEHGFGTGLRRKIERKQNPDQPAEEVVVELPVADEFFVEPLLDGFDEPENVPAPPPPAAETAPDVLVPDLRPELDAARAELAEALERERTMHAELEAASRAVMDREAEVDRWA